MSKSHPQKKKNGNDSRAQGHRGSLTIFFSLFGFSRTFPRVFLLVLIEEETKVVHLATSPFTVTQCYREIHSLVQTVYSVYQVPPPLPPWEGSLFGSFSLQGSFMGEGVRGGLCSDPTSNDALSNPVSSQQGDKNREHKNNLVCFYDFIPTVYVHKYI